VSGGTMSIVVGIVVVSVVSWVVAVFGMALFHQYERYLFCDEYGVVMVIFYSMSR
jgi:purine-cytosine permease-like protein